MLLRGARPLASRCASCLKPARRTLPIAGADGGLAGAPLASSPPAGAAWFRAALACCGYVLLAQLAMRSYKAVAAAAPVEVEALLLQAVQALAWAALLALALRARAGGRGRFRTLVQVWWVLAFAFFVAIAFDDSRHLMGAEDHDADYAHMVAASLLALGFLCMVCVMGSSGVELEFSDGDTGVSCRIE